MRKYEILYLLKPNLEDGVKSELINRLEKIVGGNIVKKEEWGLKKLAYPIKKQVEAEYILYYVEANPENIVNLKKELNIIKEVLRPMILVHEREFPFNLKTTKDLKFPERKQRKPNTTRKPRVEKETAKEETNVE